MRRTFFRRTRPCDLDRELDTLVATRAALAPDSRLERAALDQLIRCRERLRRRLGAGLPACRTP